MCKIRAKLRKNHAGIGICQMFYSQPLQTSHGPTIQGLLVGKDHCVHHDKCSRPHLGPVSIHFPPTASFPPSSQHAL